MQVKPESRGKLKGGVDKRNRKLDEQGKLQSACRNLI